MRAVIVCILACLALVSAQTHHERLVMYDREILPPGWELTGFPLQTHEIHFNVALHQTNLDQLNLRFWAVSDPTSPEYQNFMTPAEIIDMIKPLQFHKNNVVAWLQGERVTKIQDRGDSLLVHCPVSVAETMFQTKFYQFRNTETGAQIVRQMRGWSIPKTMQPFVYMITGISDFPMLSNPKVYAVDSESPMQSEGIIPATLAAQYNIPAGTTATGTSQGVIEFQAGEYYDPVGLQTFAQQVGVTIPALDPSHVVTPLPPEGIEGDLDIQYIAGVAQGAVNWYWTDADWLYDWSQNFFNAAARPHIVSLSYGWSELAQCDISTSCSTLGINSQQYVERVNTEFQKIGLLGVSLVCASGDSGANGRTDPDCSAPQLRPAYPAASPYITAVGATQLTGPNVAIPNPPPVCTTGTWTCNYGGPETAVSYDQAQFTSGGGFSNYAARPSYQADAVAAYFKSGVALPPASYYNATTRGLPDVASLGTAILIYSNDEGGIAAVGGTSASSPSFAAYMSFLNALSIKKTGKTLGFLNPLLYKMWADKPQTFTDITVGDNICTEDGCAASCTGFYCAKGWDPVTGLGVANVAEMISYVSDMLDARNFRTAEI